MHECETPVCTLPAPPKCRRCGHPFHKHNRCTTLTVSGPADPKAVADGGHGTRTVTECDCRGFIA